MVECCLTCAKSDEECEYCLRFGNHVPKDGKCNEYQPKEIATIDLISREVTPWN